MGGTICRAGRAPDQVSKSGLWLPWFFVNKFIESIRIAEEILGRPPTMIEVFVTLEQTYGKTVNNIYEVAGVMFALLREDMFYADQYSYRYTLTKQEGFCNYSETFKKKFPVGYACDTMGRVIPTTARRINLNHLKSVLLSRDEAMFNENNWIWDGEFRFLDG